jgi:GT2 family glycosyltransferase
MSLSKQFNIYAVVVTYNGASWVEKCLGSLRNSRYPLKTIVIDNNSSDDTVAQIEQRYPEVHLIKSALNLGFGKANNLGISKALKHGADYVFLLNQDAWIEGSTLDTLVTAAVANRNVGVVSPLHYTGSGVRLDQAFRSYITKNYSEQKIYEIIQRKDSQIYTSEFINAAAWLVSRNCFETVGGFGSLFFHYGEDRDYVQRMNYYGLKLGFIANAKIYHDREFRENNKSTARYSKLLANYRVGCLRRCSNVNHTLVSGFIESCIWSSKELTVLFFKKRKFFAPLLFLHLISTLLALIPSILAYRKLLTAKAKFLFLES